MLERRARAGPAPRAMATDRRVALCVARFYAELADKLEQGARAALEEAGVDDDRALHGPRRVRAAAGRQVRRRVGALRRRRLPRRGDPRRDRPLRLRVLGGGRRDQPGPAGDRRALRLRRAHRRHDGAGAGPRGRGRQARHRPPRGRGGARLARGQGRAVAAGAGRPASRSDPAAPGASRSSVDEVGVLVGARAGRREARSARAGRAPLARRRGPACRARVVAGGRDVLAGWPATPG